MKFTTEEYREYNWATEKEELEFISIDLHCKNESEFMQVWEKIKHVDGVEWCGCPTEENGEYIDTVATVHKKGRMSIADTKAAIKEIRDEIKATLKGGR